MKVQGRRQRGTRRKISTDTAFSCPVRRAALRVARKRQTECPTHSIHVLLLVSLPRLLGRAPRHHMAADGDRSSVGGTKWSFHVSAPI